ncbi:LytR C-terminal domain-containing protein [Actinomadura keratinilytica]|uniref:LytR C-terminal domain-containing protein n=1 Tax=Actinomadura keratinilytica TaxID=547461 RepID=UPI00362246D4
MARRGLQTTQIQYGPDAAKEAKTVAAAIPDAKLRKVSSLGSRVQIMVGADWDGAKRVKISSPSPSPSPTETAIETGTATQKLCK